MTMRIITETFSARSTEQMYLHPVTLSFRHSQSDLEQSFLDEYFTASLPVFRYACVLALIVFALFGILDAYLVPEQKNLFWALRYLLFCPLSLAIFLFSFSPLFKKSMQPVLFFWELIAGGIIIVMILLSPASAGFSYYSGLILVFMMCYTVVRMRFIWATSASWILIVLYEISAVSYGKAPAAVLVNNNFFFIGANLIGMFACYTMEYYVRREFLLKTLLNEEREKVKNSHDILEETVEERTGQLVEANRRLRKEMDEHEQAEEERSRVQVQLLRHQKMESIGLMAGGVAHDLNNILSGIINYPELILLDLPEDSSLRKPLEAILESGHRAAAVVADMLTVSRGVAGQMEAVSINEIVQTYLRSPEYFKFSAKYPHVWVRTELGAQLPNCKCSPVHIQKVLMNLVNNGLEAIEQQGELVISTAVASIPNQQPGTELLGAGRYLTLQVADNGTGIPGTVLQHIFEPFYTKKIMGRSGTGLGLAVVWNTVEEHNGTVIVKSGDSGTVFTVYLPVTTEESPAAVVEDTEDLHGSGTILVVDDESIQLDISSRLLASLGYLVTTADSGEKAIEFLQNHSVDLLLIDMLMDPGMNGRQTYEEIVRFAPSQKAIIASGFSESSDVKAAMELGVRAFIKKPYSMRQLGRTVKEVLRE